MVGSSLGQCKLFSWSLARLWLQHVTCNIQDLYGCGHGKGLAPFVTASHVHGGVA
jgi:hypothetical protein